MLDEVVNLVKEEYPNLPLFMLGHSMGGFITLCYGIDNPNKLQGQIFFRGCSKKASNSKWHKGQV